jgi:hypothetical protein
MNILSGSSRNLNNNSVSQTSRFTILYHINYWDRHGINIYTLNVPTGGLFCDILMVVVEEGVLEVSF